MIPIKNPTNRKRGRPRSGNMVRSFSVMLPVDIHEWAMMHPEGFSVLVRRLLTQVYDEEVKKQKIL